MHLSCAIPRPRQIAIALAGLTAVAGVVIGAPPAWAAGPPLNVSTSLAFADIGPDTYGGFTGTVNPNGQETTYYFEYGRTLRYGGHSPSRPQSIGSGTTDVPVASPDIAGLIPGSIYHYRLVAANAAATVYSDDKTFTTCAAEGCAAPTVTTEPADNVTSFSATLNAAVNPNGGSYANCFFGYSTDPSVTSGLVTTGAINAGHDNFSHRVSADITGLDPATTYYAVPACQNDVDLSDGAIVSFTTAPAPVVTTGGVSAVGTTTATVSATLTGATDNAMCRFDYGRSTRYGGHTADVPEGTASDAGSFIGVPKHLASAALYHYRAVCSFGATEVTGADRTFTTGDNAS